MASKGKTPKPEKDPAKPGTAKSSPAKPDAAPKAATSSTEKPEVTPAKGSPPPALAPTPKPKQDKQSINLWVILLLFLLIIAGGVGAGGYYLYQEQMKSQNETLAKFSQLEGQLSTLDTEADQTRQNKQSIDTLKQELQQFKTEMDTTLKAHQSSLATLDEDVMRLKDKVEPPVETPPAPSAILEGIDIEPGKEPGVLTPDSPDEETLEDSEAKKDDPEQESQKFVEWIENFFRAIWNWIAGLFS